MAAEKKKKEKTGEERSGRDRHLGVGGKKQEGKRQGGTPRRARGGGQPRRWVPGAERQSPAPRGRTRGGKPGARLLTHPRPRGRREGPRAARFAARPRRRDRGQPHGGRPRMTKKKRSRHQSSPEFHGTKNHRWGVPPGLLCPGHCQLHQTYSELPSTSSPANSVRAPTDSSPDGGEWPRRARRPACRFPRHRRRSPRRARGGPSPVGAAPRQLCISCPRAPAPARWQGLARRGGGGSQRAAASHARRRRR